MKHGKHRIPKGMKVYKMHGVAYYGRPDSRSTLIEADQFTVWAHNEEGAIKAGRDYMLMNYPLVTICTHGEVRVSVG